MAVATAKFRYPVFRRLSGLAASQERSRNSGTLALERRSSDVTSSRTDAEIITCSYDDPRSFGEIFDRHVGVIHAFVVRRMGPEGAEDVTSEVFCTAFRKRHRYDSTRPDARPWLYGIAGNLVRRRIQSDGSPTGWCGLTSSPTSVVFLRRRSRRCPPTCSPVVRSPTTAVSTSRRAGRSGNRIAAGVVRLRPRLVAGGVSTIRSGGGR